MGCNIQDLLDIGCNVKNLLEADCSIEDLLKVGFSVGDLIEGGCKVEDILSSINDKQMLLDVGYSVQELMRRDNRVEELLAEKPEKQLELQRRLQSGEKLYPGCDVSVWLRSCKKEILEPITGVTKGKIPNWLKGTLLRNGPGSLQVGNENFQHLFDGSALIHRISVLFNPGEMLSDNANISVYPFGDEFYAFAENSVVHRIDPQTLDSMERVNVSKHVNIVNHTSHPHVENGDVYNIGISLSCTGPCYSVIKFPSPVYADINGEKRKVKSPFEQAQIVASVPARWKLNPSYMHTFGITEHYFVIVEQPLSISFTTMLQRQLNNQPMAPCLKWQSNEQTRIHLLNRETGKPVANFLTDPFFYLHIINQYEENGHLVLDISCYKDANMLDCMYIKALQEVNKNINYAEMFRGRPLRFVLPLSPPAGSWGTNLVTLSGSKATAYRFMDNNIFVCPELICDLGCETPRIYYEKHVGKPYQYFYAISSDVDLDNPGTLIKVDTVQKITKTWCEDNIFPSEPVFVPSPNTKSEDDGVVLSAMIWTNGMENKVGLLVLDAVTWTELGRTEFITPTPVPKCLHGWFTSNC
ncbi:neither inactivation nor afterpotential B isoform X2 [Lycorma delicatula]|uniref:neither inactivation nor afterpotential B isoform X2 n=1 Tax=Lycorma delicatula TaxID=130591 RepID=UPI003F510D1F